MNPAGSKPLSSTMRTLGRPSASTVASASALASFGSLRSASASHSANSRSGSSRRVKSPLVSVAINISSRLRAVRQEVLRLAGFRLEQMKKGSAHHCGVDVDAGPILDADHTLINQHPQPIKNLAAALLRLTDQPCSRRIGNHVCDEHAGTEGLEVEIKLRVDVWKEADRGGIHDDLGSGRHGIGHRPFDELGLGGGLLVEQVDDRFPADRIAIDNGNRRGPC